MHLLFAAGAAGGVADHPAHRVAGRERDQFFAGLQRDVAHLLWCRVEAIERPLREGIDLHGIHVSVLGRLQTRGPVRRSEEHTSELQSLMRISYAVFCLKKKTT